MPWGCSGSKEARNRATGRSVGNDTINLTASLGFGFRGARIDLHEEYGEGMRSVFFGWLALVFGGLAYMLVIAVSGR